MTASMEACQVSRNFFATSGVAALVAQTFSAPVSSDVSPKQVVAPRSSNLSMKLPTVGLEARPEVVSDSPHLVETQSSLIEQGSRCSSVAHCTSSLALREASATRSEEHTSELQSLMRISYAVFC